MESKQLAFVIGNGFYDESQPNTNHRMHLQFGLMVMLLLQEILT